MKETLWAGLKRILLKRILYLTSYCTLILLFPFALVGSFQKGNFREHGILLYLSRDLYVAFIRLQGEKKLGRSYAGLLAFTEGMFKLGYITKEVYREHVEKYSKGLVQPPPLTQEQVEEQNKLEELEKQFSNVLKQGLNTLSEKSRQYWIRKAEEYRGKIPNAKLILALAYGEHGEVSNGKV